MGAEYLMTHPASVRETRRLTRLAEGLIQCFPVAERFCTPLMTIRESLINLYSLMSPHYNLVEDTDGEVFFEHSRASQRTQKAEPPYNGPRPTRFDRLNED
jgi:hypothetical protein